MAAEDAEMAREWEQRRAQEHAEAERERQRAVAGQRLVGDG